jgi:tetratricopeptide (TPR) repeat protein
VAGDLSARFAVPPDPGDARTLDDLIAQLRLLKTWAGNPSYETLTRRVNAAWRAAGRSEREWATSKNTVAACFILGRRRPNDDLLLGIVAALNPDPAYVIQWRQALRVVRGEAEAATFVTAQPKLPDSIAEFTGRETELARLTELIEAGAGMPLVISAIEGMAGVGKTQLAVHAGNQILSKYGMRRVLFVNLRGFHDNPHQPPADPAAVLDSFLRLLDVPGHAIPHDLDGRRRLYRQLLGGQRALIVLDNAATAAQVQPLLPDSPSCVTLITSRRTLSELPAAAHLRLDVFTPAESVDYLRRSIGAGRVDADPDTAGRIADALGCLPLALALTAARINAHPDWTLADHLQRLHQRRADLRLDDAVAASLSLSYDDLAPAHQHLLRMLSLHPGVDLDTHAAAALTGTDHATAQRHLHYLLTNHLLLHKNPGRYELHDLIRGYARARVHDDDRPPDQRAALTRLFDHYTHTTLLAAQLAYPQDRGRLPKARTPATPGPDLAGQTEAAAWLDAEQRNLLATAAHAAHHGWPVHISQLSQALARYLTTRALYADAYTLHSHALHATLSVDDRIGQGHALAYLANVCPPIGHHEQAIDHLQQALAIFRECGDRVGEGRALWRLGEIYQRVGRHQQAINHHQQALTIARETRDRASEVPALSSLGEVYLMMGRYEQAINHLQQSLALARQVGDRTSEGCALGGLGEIYRLLGRHERAIDTLQQALATFREGGNRADGSYALAILGFIYRQVGRYEQAIDHLQQALATFRECSDRAGESYALTFLGEVYRQMGRHEQAIDHHQQALTIARQTGNRNSEFEAHHGLGEDLRATHQPDQALTHHQHAATLAVDLDQPHDHARALNGIAHAHHALGHHDKARHHWQQALQIFTQLNTPEADQIRAHLDNEPPWRFRTVGVTKMVPDWNGI